MSFEFPETPILLYPSLAELVGVEAAVLMSLYQQQKERLDSLSGTKTRFQLILSREQWLNLARFWDEDALALHTNTLVEHRLIEATYAPDGRVTIQWVDDKAPEPYAPMEEQVEVVSRLPVVESVPTSQDPYEVYAAEQTTASEDTPYYPDSKLTDQSTQTYASNPGPAPTFGGSIGWARKAQQVRDGQSDELQAKFFQQEQLRKQLHSMELGWQPSQNFYALLPRHNIPIQFAHSCLDEFILYWLDKDRKETNWDQKFLGWVKREWVRKQTDEGRQQRLSQEQQTGFKHENPRRDTRENRKRVTAAVMDIKDTDW